ncbi:MAG: penicillin-binding protein 2 [Flavobacteriales bacterium]|nr:penicillin-binding protein 2 [Bacteroidota bacterium]MCB9241490.1 penicillin-binding protein 2 [Flavobacteriales bacterium]
MSVDQNRSRVIGGVIVMCGLILVIRLFYLQVVSDTYAQKSDRISKRIVTEYPDRGLITDRHGKLIVFNADAYDLTVSMPMYSRSFDTTTFCTLLRITPEEFVQMMGKAKKTAYNGKAVFKKNLTTPEFARIQEGIYQFRDFQIETHSDRKYSMAIAAHTLGYVAEISKNELERDASEYYDAGEYIGKSGLEQFYEEQLRGIKGRQHYMVNNIGQIKERVNGGKDDIRAFPGMPMEISMDAALQAYGEELMQGKTGSIVAIEPSTGEILAMVTSPGYDPNDFAIKNLSHNYPKLAVDPSKPLLNRAVAAQYPPGSVFKLIMALIGLEEGVLTENTHFSCHGGFHKGSLTVRCHPHPGFPDLKYSIQTSCNAYYCNAFREILHQDKFKNIEEGYNNWRNYLVNFGLGSRLGVDINQEQGGNVPTAQYFHKIHGENSWSYIRIISLSIGQGELLLTPLQMANVAAIIANRGYFFTPHFARLIDGKNTIPEQFKTKHQTGVSDYNFATVVDAMAAVFSGGTAAGARIPGIEMCGKTGTVQNPHGENHSMFIAFAPRDNPKIAIATVVENAGYGSTYAAPISALMMEKYLRPDTTSSRMDLYNRMTGKTATHTTAHQADTSHGAGE